MRLQGKIALITGASRGIGKEIAKRYALEGAHLILAARTVSDLERVDDEIKSMVPDAQVTLVPVDLSKQPQLKELCVSLAQRFQKLDILVGNAGILGTLTPITHQQLSEVQEVMNVNLMANWTLLHYLDPLLQKAPHGRAIFLTSEVVEPEPFWGAYAVSKAALEHLVKTYAVEQALSSVKANLVDPGGVWTQMYAQAFPGETGKDMQKPEEIMDVFVDLASDACTLNGQVMRAQ